MTDITQQKGLSILIMFTDPTLPSAHTTVLECLLPILVGLQAVVLVGPLSCFRNWDLVSQSLEDLEPTTCWLYIGALGRWRLKIYHLESMMATWIVMFSKGLSETSLIWRYTLAGSIGGLLEDDWISSVICDTFIPLWFHLIQILQLWNRLSEFLIIDDQIIDSFLALYAWIISWTKLCNLQQIWMHVRGE